MLTTSHTINVHFVHVDSKCTGVHVFFRNHENDDGILRQMRELYASSCKIVRLFQIYSKGVNLTWEKFL